MQPVRAYAENRGDGAEPWRRPVSGNDSALVVSDDRESDTELGTDAIRALNLHQANFEAMRFTAPSTPGTYTYKACVDAVAG